MSKPETRTRSFGSWGARLFMAAGLFMAVNAALLWIRYLSDLELSVAWPAIPGTVGLACAVLGLIMLYPRAKPRAPRLAKAGVGFAVVSALSLGGSALLIVYAAMSAREGSEFPPPAALALIAAFLVAMVISFLSYAVAFLIPAGRRMLGAFLLVPLLMWGLMLITSAIMGIEIGLALDFYTNPTIAAAFIGIGLRLRRAKN